MTPLLALAVGAGAAAAGWRLGALTPGGGAAAATVGAAVLWAGGWPAALVLAVFFLAGSGITRLLPLPATDLDPKGDRRDAWQVLANGGPAALGALVVPPDAATWIVSGALAAAGADTFATTVGLRSARPPRDILSGRRVAPGTSGGVTLIGTAGAAAGAALVAAAGAAAGGVRLFPIALLLGILGMGVDAALGSAVQGRFECPACRVPSERRRHRCGTPTTLRGGLPWLTNDGVNALATGAAALAAWCCWRWWGS